MSGITNPSNVSLVCYTFTRVPRLRPFTVWVCLPGNSSPEGTLVWQFHPEVDRLFNATHLSTLPEPIQEVVRYYAYFCKDRQAYLYSLDDDRFTNHSNTPNCRSLGDTMVAIRDIARNEELTIDYREIGYTMAGIEV